MKYYAVSQSKIIISILILQMVTISISLSQVDLLLAFQLITLTFTFLCLFISFQVQITDHYINYQILFLKRRIYGKEIKPDQIQSIQFVRVGWTTKNASIKRRKGLPIRLIAFKPHRLYQELEQFAIAHQIPFTKSKDYQTLERKNLREHHSGLN
ncbi:hypothetical protein [Gracilibacillus massiliensis]|uniref:hypothetical protein n=1 Tax=Gracilibacillus massiliensis TaxID=1564956 RepID=UPI00071D91A5|nr:hypothetical protein [Gracilibacillus massiliensis]